MKFITYTGWEQLPESANELFAQAEKDSLFFTRQWFECVAMSLEGDDRMLLACVVSDGKVLAILPLINSNANTWSSLKHPYATHYSLLLAKHEQQQVLTCLAQGLSQLPLKGLLLGPVADDDQNITGLQQSMEAVGFKSIQRFRLYNWIYRLQGQSYADYFTARPAKLRNTIARKQRKLEREHGYDIRLYTGNEVPQAMSDYYAVYNASWKANEQFVDFLDGIVVSFSEQGWSRLAVLYVKGQPVAAQLWFVLHAKANIFRLSYDEKWKQYSPGSILTAFLMEYVIDTDNVEEIDFLTGNEVYKQDWMSERRERFTLSFVWSVRPAGIFQRIVKFLGNMLKRQ